MTKEICIRVFADPVQIRECRKKVSENGKIFSRLASILALAGNDVRLKILYLLEEEEQLCPCDLSDILGMSVPAISQHLRKLKDANVIESKRVGQTIFYSLSDENLKLLRTFFKHIDQTARKEVTV